jgi:hypothetical protein
MATNEIHELDVTPHEGEHPAPLGWFVFAGALVVWGAWYLWSYTPSLGGWSQGQALADETTLSGTNVLATVAFTVVAALAAGALLLAASLRKRGSGR